MPNMLLLHIKIYIHKYYGNLKQTALSEGKIFIENVEPQT